MKQTAGSRSGSTNLITTHVAASENRDVIKTLNNDLVILLQKNNPNADTKNSNEDDASPNKRPPGPQASSRKG